MSEKKAKLIERKLELKVGNDNGNSEHDLIINGMMIQEPNVYLPIYELPFSDDVIPEDIIENIQKDLVVSVVSPSVKTGMYLVGEAALRTGQIVTIMEVDIDKKYDVELPILNTLAQISGKALQIVFEKDKKIPDSIYLTVDQTTALPVTQHTDDFASKFEQKFMNGPHNVTLHLGTKVSVTVTVVFDFTKVVPEATPVTFALQKDIDGSPRKGKIFEEFEKEYKMAEGIDGDYFKDKRILHLDIGDGTTEAPITEGNIFLREYIKGAGINNGAGHAIDEAILTFSSLTNINNVPRQYISEVLKNPNYSSRHYSKAKNSVRIPLEQQSIPILNLARRQLQKARMDVDIICVYGGGSILFKDIIYKKLKDLADENGMQLLYIPAEYAVTMNAEGLYIFTMSGIYQGLKKKSKGMITK